MICRYSSNNMCKLSWYLYFLLYNIVYSYAYFIMREYIHVFVGIWGPHSRWASLSGYDGYIWKCLFYEQFFMYTCMFLSVPSVNKVFIIIIILILRIERGFIWLKMSMFRFTQYIFLFRSLQIAQQIIQYTLLILVQLWTICLLSQIKLLSVYRLCCSHPFYCTCPSF